MTELVEEREKSLVTPLASILSPLAAPTSSAITPLNADVKSPNSMYDQESIDNLQNDELAKGANLSVDMGQSPLSQSTTEVSATPHMSDDIVPLDTPLMVQVSSDKGDSLLTMGTPKSKNTDAVGVNNDAVDDLITPKVEVLDP